MNKQLIKKIICYAVITVLLICMFPVHEEGPAYGKNLFDNRLEVTILSLDGGGDCSLIKYNDIEILIDSGASESDFTNIEDEINKLMENDSDKCWDYLIFTHPDKDHIGNALKIFDLFSDGKSEWTIGTIIDYDIKELDDEAFSDTARKYRHQRDEIVHQCKAHYFSASELSENELVREFSLGVDCKLSILYNYYDKYENCTKNGINTNLTVDNNLLSVCCVISIGNQKALFTGDLLVAGEDMLSKYHKDLLSKVTLYKAAHHGSSSANSERFIDLIRPQYVAVTMYKKANFFSEAFKYFYRYTDYIFPTAVEYSGYYPELYGNEKYILDGTKIEVNTELNNVNGVPASIWNAYLEEYGIYWFGSALYSSENSISDFVSVYSFDEEKPTYCNCTLIKYGHYDIVIDCGSLDTSSTSFLDILSEYVIDGTIEYVIVTHYQPQCISQLVGNNKKNGLFDLFSVGMLIDGKGTNFKDKIEECVLYPRYLNEVDDLNIPRITVSSYEIKKIKLTDALSLTVMGNGNGDSGLIDENNYSLVTIVSFFNSKMLFVGDLADYSGILKNRKDQIENVDYLRLSNTAVSCDEIPEYEKFARITRPKNIVIGTPTGYMLSNGKVVYSEKKIHAIKNLFNVPYSCKLYSKGYINNDGSYGRDSTDMGKNIFTVFQSERGTQYEMERR